MITPEQSSGEGRKADERFEWASFTPLTDDKGRKI